MKSRHLSQQRKFHKQLRRKQDKNEKRPPAVPCITRADTYMDKIRSVYLEDIASMINTNRLWSDAFQGSNRRVSFILKKGKWLDTPETSRDITLLRVFHAIGSTELFNRLATEHDKCQIEDAVNNEISDTLEEARRLITNRFATTPLISLCRKSLNINKFNSRASYVSGCCQPINFGLKPVLVYRLFLRRNRVKCPSASGFPDICRANR